MIALDRQSYNVHASCARVGVLRVEESVEGKCIRIGSSLSTNETSLLSNKSHQRYFISQIDFIQ